jgi:hypothetical protein
MRNHAERENELAKTSTMSKQKERNLRIWELAKCCEDFDGLVDPFLSVMVAIIIRSDGPA